MTIRATTPAPGARAPGAVEVEALAGHVPPVNDADRDGGRPGRASALVPVHGRRRRWPWIMAAALVFLLVAGAAFTVWGTPVLGLRRVEVALRTGPADEQLTAEVRAAVALPDGVPLVRINLLDVRARVQQIPEIDRAEVARRWPNDLVITVRARTPSAVTSANGALWLLDSGGHPYAQLAGPPPPGLVTVNLATPGPADPATLAALDVVGALTAEFRRTVAGVSALSAHDVTVTLLDKRTVRWGGPADGARKMQLLPALLAAQRGSVYDISDPGMVTVRP